MAFETVRVGGTVPVSVASLPLPSGGATEAKQDTGNTALSAIQTAVETLDNAVAGSEMQVDVVTSALPSGASTAANQTTLIGHVDGIEGLLTTIDTDTGSMATDLGTIAGAVSGSEMQVDVLTMPSTAVTNAGTFAVQPTASGTGGMSYTMLGLAAEDNDVVIKASAATIYFISIQSLDATPVYLKLFNLASFTPGTSSATLQFMCPANSTAANGAGIVLNFGPTGIQFDTGLCALIATGIGLTNNTAVSANEVVVTIGWE